MESFKRIYHQQNLCLHNKIKLNESLILLGKLTNDIFTVKEKSYLYSRGIVDLISVKRCLRIILKDAHYYGVKWYKKGLNTKNNSVIAYCGNYNQLEFGIIQSFLVCESSSSHYIFCVLSPLIRNVDTFRMYNTAIPHVISLLPPETTNSENVVIPVERICSPCVYMSFSDVENTAYVATLANLLEKD